MARFTGLGFIDTATFTATYVLKYRSALIESNDPLHYNVQYLDLVLDGEDQEIIKSWRAAQALLQRLRAMLAGADAKAHITNAHVLALRPLARIAWDDEEDVALTRIHLQLIPAPGAFVYSGGEQACLPVGFATIVDHTALHSEINAGTEYTSHKLVIEVVSDPL